MGNLLVFQLQGLTEPRGDVVSATISRTLAISVVLVDDHELARAGVKHLLNRDPEITVIGEAQGCDEAISVISRLQPDVVLLDIRLSQGSGIDVGRACQTIAPFTRLVVLTGYDDQQYVMALAKLGVVGYLLKTVSAQQLTRAVHDAVEGRLVFSPEVADKVKAILGQDEGTTSKVEPSLGQDEGTTSKVKATRGQDERTTSFNPEKLSGLSSRQLQVLGLLAKGYRNSEIAGAMGINSKTVETHIAHLLLKLGVKNRTQAVVHALENGWSPGSRLNVEEQHGSNYCRDCRPNPLKTKLQISTEY